MRRFGFYQLRMKHSPLAGIVFVLVLSAVLPAVSQNETQDLEVYRRELARDPKNSEARARLAAVLERKKDYDGMIQLLAEHKDKIGRGGLLLLARAYGKVSRGGDEVATLELANARYPKDASLQTELAIALARAGRHDESIAAFYKIKEAHPKHVPAYDGLLKELVTAQSRQEARDLLSDMIKRFGMKPRWASESCSLYTADAFHTKAVEMCRRARTLDAGNPMNAVNLAATYREQGEAEKARKILVEAAKRIKRSEPVQTALGDYFVEKKNYVDALRWYRAGAQNDAKSYRAQLGYAQAALELQKLEEAMTAFSAACRIDRQAIREFQSALGRIRQRGDLKWQTRFEEAIVKNCQTSM